MAKVVGLDLSLTSTGVGTARWTGRVQPKKLTGYNRLRFIRDAILEVLDREKPELVVVEGPVYGALGRGQHERGGLWWMVGEAVDLAGYSIGVAPPTAVKKYATGKGNADKDEIILAAARKFEWFAGGNDEADALWICALGHDYLGEPLSEMPAKNREAVSSCEWPAT